MHLAASARFGRSTLSGAISFITKDRSKEWVACVKPDVANFGTVDTSRMVEGPIAEEMLPFRLKRAVTIPLTDSLRTAIAGYPAGLGRALSFALLEKRIFGVRAFYRF